MDSWQKPTVTDEDVEPERVAAVQRAVDRLWPTDEREKRGYMVAVLVHEAATARACGLT